MGCNTVSGCSLLAVCLQSWCPSLLSSSCLPVDSSLWTGHKACSSSAIPQPPAIPSYLYRHNTNNWIHELLLRVSLGSEGAWPHLISGVRELTLKSWWKMWSGNNLQQRQRRREEEERRVNTEHRSSSRVSLSWQGGVREQIELKTHPGWDDASAERDTYGETNEFSHNRDGNILYRHTEGCWAFAHLAVCRLKNCQCGIKQCLRNGCEEKTTTRWSQQQISSILNTRLKICAGK